MKIIQTFSLLFFLTWCSPVSQAQLEASVPITPGQTIERAIGLQETHSYEFSAGAGEIVRFDVAQKNVDPQLIISDAGGKPLREMYFERIAGTTSISFIIVEQAKFRLQLKPSGKSKMTGSYRLQMSQPRSANHLDHLRIEAEIALNGQGLLPRRVEKRSEKTTLAQLQKRLARLQQILNDWQRLNEPNFELETWRQIGLAADRQQDVELEKTALAKLRLLAQANKELVAEAWALSELANLSASRGELETSEKYLITAVELAGQSGAKMVEAAISHRLGNHYQGVKQYEKSRLYLGKAIDIYTELRSDVEVASARVSLAVVSTKFDQALDSTAVYNESLAVFEKNGAFYEKANVLRNLGAEASAKKQFELADKYLKEALGLMELYGEPNDEAFVLLGLGLTETGRNNGAAQQYLEKALAKLGERSELATEVKVLMALAQLDLLDFQKGGLTKSIAKFEKAVELATQAGLQNEKMVIHGVLSQLYIIVGQNEEGARHADAAKKTGEKNQDKSLEEAATIASAGVDQSQGDYPAAIRAFENNVKVGEERKQNDLIALSYQRLGGIFVELNDLRRAENAYQKASEFSAKIDNATMKRSLVLSVAELYLRQNKLSEARKELEDLQAEVKNNDALIEALAQQLLGRLALKEKNYPAAQAKFTGVLSLQSQATLPWQLKTEVPSLAALALQGLGDTFAALGNTTEAQNYYQQALVTFRLIDSATGEAAIFETLMNSELKTGNSRLAIFYGKQSVNLLQTVRRSIKPLEANIRRNFLSFVESAYRTLAATLLEEGRVVEAQEVLSLLKEEEFYQFTRRSPTAIPDVLRPIELSVEEAEAARKYQTLTDNIRATAQRVGELEIASRSQTLPAEKQVELQNLKTELSSLNVTILGMLKALSQNFGQTKTVGKPDRSATQTYAWQKRLTELGAGTVLLTTLLTEDRYYVIVTTPDRQVVRSQEISSAELTQQICDLRDLLQEPSSLVLGDPRAKNEVPLLQKLYQVLVKPIEGDLLQANAKTLLWSLDGVLRYVPFAVLHDGENHLVERYVNLVVTLAQPPENMRVSPANWRALGAGVSTPIGAEALPQVELELQAIVRDETAGNPKTEKGIFIGKRLLNREFSREKFNDALKRKPQIVHLATHFKLSAVHDVDSFLVLGDGDKLNLAELRTEQLFDLAGVHLLTLSACETASDAADANGAEIESLAVIAQRRGAKTVLASLWSIRDDGTQLLMTQFYRLYKNGKGNISKAEALRQAQIMLLKNRNPGHNYSHPAYWGAFIVLGNL